MDPTSWPVGTLLEHQYMGKCIVLDPRPGSPYVTVQWPSSMPPAGSSFTDYPSDVFKAECSAPPHIQLTVTYDDLNPS